MKTPSNPETQLSWWIGASFFFFLAALYGLVAVVDEPRFGIWAMGFIVVGVLMLPPVKQPEWVRLTALVVGIILARLG